jgi:hypothetical protein
MAMAGSVLIVVGVTWLVGVVMWLLFGRGEFAIAILRPVPMKALMSAFVVTYGCLLVGWIVPLAVGIRIRHGKSRNRSGD